MMYAVDECRFHVVCYVICLETLSTISSQILLETRLHHEPVSGRSELLLAQLKAQCAGCDYVTMETLRIRALAPVNSKRV